MMPLVSPSAIANLRKVAESGMITPVTIQKRSNENNDNPYSDDESQYTPQDTVVMGWLRSMPAGDISQMTAMAGVASTHRLFVPVGTDIDTGDRVVIGGDQFTVQDTSRESSYKVLLRVMLERIE